MKVMGGTMNRNQVLAAAIVVTVNLGACLQHGPGEEALHGVWRGEHAGQQLTFSFESDKTCELRFEDSELGAVTVWTGRFETNFSKDPIPISIRNIPQLEHSIHTILRLDAADELTVAPFASRWRLRAVSFDPERSMRLVRAVNADS